MIIIFRIYSTLTNKRVRSIVFSGTHPQLEVFHRTLYAKDKHFHRNAVHQVPPLTYMKNHMRAYVLSLDKDFGFGYKYKVN